MRSKTRQIRIDADEGFFEEVKNQKLRRGLTTQELVTRAIRLYSSIPEDRLSWLFEGEQESFTIPFSGVLKAVDPRRRLRKTENVSSSPEALQQLQQVIQATAEAHQDRADAELLLDLLKQFPPEKIRLILDAMRLDLKYYQSARIVSKGEER